MLNIPSNVVDNNYRYKMPRMQLKIQSKGNGIKTNIVNLPDVAKAIRINQMYILKYFGSEKGCQTLEKASQAKSNKQGKSNTSYIIQGEFNEAELLKVLDKFIDKYILCPKCKLPEMHLFVEKQRINGKCDSCPFNGEIDNKHRLTAFILKNPPQFKPQAAKRNQVKIVKVEEGGKEETVKTENQKTSQEQSSQKKEVSKEDQATDLFSSETIQFGNEEFEQFIQYTSDFIKRRANIDFDIACAEIVANLKPLNLKKPFYAYAIFHSFFTVNINKQVGEKGTMYKALMKKLAVKKNKNLQKKEAEAFVEQSIEIETMLNLQYLFLELNKEREEEFTKAIPTILFNLLEASLFTEQFIKTWSKNLIADLDKMFMYNQERDEKFKKIAKDFIQYINEDDEEEGEGEQDN